MPPSAAGSTSLVEERRAAALEAYEREPVPTWRRSGFWTTTLRHLRLEDLGPRHYPPVSSFAELPDVVREAIDPDEIGGLLVQQGASSIYAQLDPDLSAQGVILCSLERAIEDHPDLVREHFGRRLPCDEGKFPAAAAAFWTGGAFLHVPREVRVERPLQVVWTLDEPGTAQYAHTLAVVGEMAECSVREYHLAPDLDGQALHAGAFELYAGTGSRVKVAHLQDWGGGEVYDISTKRVEIGRDAHATWVPVHLGGRLTKQTLDIVTAQKGASMRHSGLYFTEGREHLDLFTTDLHEQGHTIGDTVWKGALLGESRASYEGLINIVHGAQESHTYLQTHSMLLSPKARADAIPSLIVKTDSVSASHGGTVGEIDEDQVFYMMSRGIPRQDAVRILVEGYFEEVVQRMEDPALERLVRDRIAAKLSAADAQIQAYVAER